MAIRIRICPGMVETGHFKSRMSFYLSSFYYLCIDNWLTIELLISDTRANGQSRRHVSEIVGI